MEEKKKEKLPLDAKLLADAIIELNISRRSVSLYPSDHPITRKAIKSAHALLKKLFEHRNSINIGVAKNVLMIDNYTLDSKNPVFGDFALALHKKGIATITFYAGLEEKELLGFHVLITEKELPARKELIEFYKAQHLKHVKLMPIDMTKLMFVEGAQKKDDDSSEAIWEEYVYGLLEGTLADSDSENIVFRIAPNDFAKVLNDYQAENKEESYDRIINSYLRKKDLQELNRESFRRFMTLVENLKTDVKEQVLARVFKHPTMALENAEEALGQLAPEDIDRMFDLVKDQATLPKSMKNILHKLSSFRTPVAEVDDIMEETTRLDDIEMGEKITNLFRDDQFDEFVGTDYQDDLEKMLPMHSFNKNALTQSIVTSMKPKNIDSIFSAVILELIHYKETDRNQCLQILTRLCELVDVCLETGRFEEILKIHNTLYSFMLEGRFRVEISGMLEYFFHSGQFVAKLLDVFRVWGRSHRESAQRLARVFKVYLISPLIGSLNEEQQSSQRKFYISILISLGKDVIPEAVRRLGDKRWFVVRNMIYLIRQCNGSEYIGKIKPFTKHKNEQICLEAFKTLLHFNSPDIHFHLKTFFEEKSPGLREKAIKLTGVYRVQAAVPYLIKILEKRGILDSEIEQKYAAVRALGKIGDPSALGALKRLFSTSKLTLFTKGYEDLKVEIIRSLQGYPVHEVRSLLELALESKNEMAKALAQELIERRVNVST
jgi:hypothetical protein